MAFDMEDLLNMILEKGSTIALVACSNGQSRANDTKINSLIEYLEENKFEGAVLVAKDKDIILAKGYGLCDRKNPESDDIEINTTFEIGSITKQMTAAAIMQLASEREIMALAAPSPSLMA